MIDKPLYMIQEVLLTTIDVRNSTTSYFLSSVAFESKYKRDYFLKKLFLKILSVLWNQNVLKEEIGDRFLSLQTNIKHTETMKELNQEEWREQLSNDNNAAILDVRTEEEVEEGYIPNAKNIDIYKGQEFINEIEKLDKDKDYYVYCRSGKRSAQACTLMDSLGFKKTYNLIGGFSEWKGEKSE